MPNSQHRHSASNGGPHHSLPCLLCDGYYVPTAQNVIDDSTLQISDDEVYHTQRTVIYRGTVRGQRHVNTTIQPSHHNNARSPNATDLSTPNLITRSIQSPTMAPMASPSLPHNSSPSSTNSLHYKPIQVGDVDRQPGKRPTNLNCTHMIRVLVKTVQSGSKINSSLRNTIQRLNYELVALNQLTKSSVDTSVLRPTDDEDAISPTVLQPLAFTTLENNLPALIVPDAGGISLQTLLDNSPLGNGLHMINVLEIGVALFKELRWFHARNVIINSISPTTILYNPQHQACQLIEFSNSSLLSEEHATAGAMTLPSIQRLRYTSPESTGRASRLVDQRSDLYVAGLVLYELISGQPPFTSDDGMELMHSHLARKPTPLQSMLRDRVDTFINRGSSDNEDDSRVFNNITNQCFATLCDLVMKLLQKTPEERYNSAAGALPDLQLCIKHMKLGYDLMKRGQRPSDAALLQQYERQHLLIGQHDMASKFRVSAKLYGRDEELHLLMNTYNKLNKADLVEPHLVFISGWSGIGKTALVESLYKPITQSHGLFLRCKFDIYRRGSGTILNAFDTPINEIMSRDDVDEWKDRFISALNRNGRAITEFVPALEKLIGVQPPLLDVNPIEKVAIFEQTFLKFINVFATKESPLTLFIDDVQWSDAASLHLIKLLFMQTSSHLLLLCSYRSNEVGPEHPLRQVQEDLETLLARSSGSDESDDAEDSSAQRKQYRVSRLHTLTLEALPLTAVAQLLSDTLHCEISQVQPLAQLFHTKSAGNGFHLSQLIKRMYEQHVFTFNYETASWQWDLQLAQQVHCGDTVVELLAMQIRQLTDDQQHIMKVAACLGNQFTLRQLGVVMERDIQQVARDVWAIVSEKGLLLPTGSSYQFFLLSQPQTYTESNVLNSNEPSPTNSSAMTPPGQQRQQSAVQLQLAGDGSDVTLRFLHDGVQQTAYQMMSADERHIEHLRIARLLYADYSQQDALKENCFEVADHYISAGFDHMTDVDELVRVTKLGIIAATKAKQGTAFVPGLRYVEHYRIAFKRVGAYKVLGSLDALENMEASETELYERVVAWLYTEYYDVCREAAAMAIELYYLTSQFPRAAVLIKGAMKHVRSNLDRVELLELQMKQQAVHESQIVVAVQTGIDALKLLGVELAVYSQCKDEIRQKLSSIDQLLKAPTIIDPVDAAIARVLSLLGGPMHVTGIRFQDLCATMMLHFARAGPSDSTHYQFQCYGIALWSDGLISECYSAGLASLKLLSRYGGQNNAYYTKTILCWYSFTGIWREAIPPNLPPMLQARDAALELNGDLQYQAHLTYFYSEHSWFAGGALQAITEVYKQYSQEMLQKKVMAYALALRIPHRMLKRMANKAETEVEKERPTGRNKLQINSSVLTREELSCIESEDVSEMIALTNTDHNIALVGVWVWHATWLVLRGRTERALIAAKKAYELGLKSDALLANAMATYMYGLSLAATMLGPTHSVATPPTLADDWLPEHDSKSPDKQRRSVNIAEWKTLNMLCRKLKLWAHHNPAVLGCRSLLLQAERSRVAIFGYQRYDLVATVIDQYQSAMNMSRMNRHQLDHALASQLYGQFLQAMKRTVEAKSAFREAYVTYLVWGAEKLAQLLRDQHGEAIATDNSLNAAPTHTMDNSPLSSATNHRINDRISPVPSPSLVNRPKLRAFGSTSASSTNSMSTTDNLYGGSDAAAGDNIDMIAVMKATQAFSVETNLSVLLSRLMRIVLQHSGATRGCLLLQRDDKWHVELSATTGNTPDAGSIQQRLVDSPTGKQRVRARAHSLRPGSIDMTHDPVMPTDVNTSNDSSPAGKSSPTLTIDESPDDSNYSNDVKVQQHHSEKIATILPAAFFNYVRTTSQSMLLSRADILSGPYANDQYIVQNGAPRSVLVTPIMRQGRLQAILYLENNLLESAFSQSHLQLLHLLCTQAALSMENARLYTQARTSASELQSQNKRLADEVVQRQEAQAAAEKASMVRAQLIANVSHELRTPLNALLGVSQLLADTELTHQQQDFVKMLDSSGRLLLSSINDVLDLSKLESGNFVIDIQPVQLRDVVESCVCMFTETARAKSLDIGCIIEGSVPNMVLTDGLRVQQILVNLLSNSLKFTNEGSVTLRIGTVQSQPSTDAADIVSPAVPISSPGDSNRVILHCEVVDSGIGMKESDLAQLFQSFFQVDSAITRKYNGTGLGLSICKKLMEALGGRIGVRSAGLGHGSTFWLTLPVQIPADSLKRPPRQIAIEGIAILLDLPRATQQVVQNVANLAGLSVRLIPPPQPTTDATAPLHDIVTLAASTDEPTNIPPISAAIADQVRVIALRSHEQSYGPISEPAWVTDIEPILPSHSSAPILVIILSGSSTVGRKMTITSPTTVTATHDFKDKDKDSLAVPNGPGTPTSANGYGNSNHIARATSAPAEQVWKAHKQLLTSTSNGDYSNRHVSRCTFIDVPASLAARHPLLRCVNASAPVLQSELQDIVREHIQKNSPKSPILRLADRMSRRPMPDITELPSSQNASNSSAFSVTSPLGHPANAVTAPRPSALNTDSSADSSKAPAQRMKRIDKLSNTMPLKILLVEDNIVNQKMMVLLLGRMGYSIDVAGDGLQALERITSGKPQYDVIFMDVGMDRMGGIECTQRIRKHEQTCAEPRYHHIIGQTASANLRAECLEAGMDSFITKPISVASLSTAIKTAHEQKQQWSAKHQPVA